MYTYVDSQWFLGQWGLILPSFLACIYITKLSTGASLAVQWLRLHTLNAKAWIQSLARKLRSYMLYGTVKKLYKSTKMAYYFCIIKKKQGCFVSCKKFEVMLGMIKAGRTFSRILAGNVLRALTHTASRGALPLWSDSLLGSAVSVPAVSVAFCPLLDPGRMQGATIWVPLPPSKSFFGLRLHTSLGFPGDSDCKESACHAGDPGSILGSGRSSGEGNSYPLQYSCLEIPWCAAVHGVTKSCTWVSN